MQGWKRFRVSTTLVLLVGVVSLSGVLAGPAWAAHLPCTITGTNDNDFIVGSDQRDIICARAGGDFVDAQGGNDDIHGQDGNDEIFGRSGNDRMTGNQGRDSLLGGQGRDQLIAHEDDQGGDFVDGGPDRDVCFVDRGDTAINCEFLIVR
jgi:Ca2+-binding RTX toxin-like protein